MLDIWHGVALYGWLYNVAWRYTAGYMAWRYTAGYMAVRYTAGYMTWRGVIRMVI